MIDLKMVNILNTVFGSVTVATIMDYLPEAVGLIAGITIIIVNIASTRAKNAQRRLAEKQLSKLDENHSE